MLIKRKGSPYWYYKFTIKGKTVFRSTGTSDKEQAEAIAAREHGDAFEQIKLGSKPRYLWQDAVLRFLNEGQQKRSIETEKCHLRWLAKHLDNVCLDEISTAIIEKIIAAKLKESGTTRCNRMTSVISAILNKSHKKWGWIDSVPHIRKFREGGQRLRWLTREEASRLLAELPEHSRDMAIFTLATGLRESNVTGLEWGQIDMKSRIAWIHADQSKNGKVIRIPLNQDAVNVLIKQIGKHQRRVFTFDGKPIENASTRSFRKAMERAGIDGACWHTLRHTWASWHVQAGTPLNVLQELGGWSDLKIVQRYAHLAPEHLSDHADRISGMLTETGGNVVSLTKANR